MLCLIGKLLCRNMRQLECRLPLCLQILLFLSLVLKDCMAHQCSLLRWKLTECSLINPALLFLVKHLVIGQCQKAPNFSAFHWSAHGSLASIGQHFVATRVVHLPKRTERSLITESNQTGLITKLDQVVGTMHSFNSWFVPLFISKKLPWNIFTVTWKWPIYAFDIRCKEHFLWEVILNLDTK